MAASSFYGRQPPQPQAAAAVLTRSVDKRKLQIPGAFQLILALYIFFTGDLPEVIQALVFGVQGGATSEFSVAMALSVSRDLLLVAAVVVLSKQALGILHPLLLAVIVWPIMTKVPAVIEDYGGWLGLASGVPVSAPRFAGLPGYSESALWIAVAKYNALLLVALASTYAGFWLFTRKQKLTRLPVRLPSPVAIRSVLIGLFIFSTLVLVAFIYFRGGLDVHVTSLGQGRYRELAGNGPILVLTDLGAVALYLWVATRPRDVKLPVFLVCAAIVVIVQFVSDGSRGSALGVPLMIGLIWAVRTQRVPWRAALVLIPLLFVSLGLLNAVRTSSWTGQTAGEAFATTGWTASAERAQAEVANRELLSGAVPVVERGFEVSGGPLLGSSYVGAFTALVPRALWPDKPRGPGSLYMQMFFGSQWEGSTTPIGNTSEIYWNFGVPGLVILSILYGLILRGVYHLFWRRYPDPFVTVFYVFILTSFGFGTYELVELQQSLLLLMVCYFAVAFFVPRQSGPRLSVIHPANEPAKVLNARTF